MTSKRKRRGVPPKYKSAQEMQERIDEYFAV